MTCKVESYEFSNNVLLFIRSNLKKRSQAISINSSLSTSKEIMAGLPSGSILELLLFKIFLNHIL